MTTTITTQHLDPADSQSVLGSEIKNLYDLRQAYRTCGIVAIDTEPYKHDMDLVHEIGLSFLPPLDSLQGSTRLPPTNFATFLVETYSISIIGRRRQLKGSREPLTNGPFLPTFPEDVEDTIVAILEMFLSTMPTRPPLILTGFDLRTEMKVLRNQYPRVLQYFSAWTDSKYILSQGSGLGKGDDVKGKGPSFFPSTAPNIFWSMPGQTVVEGYCANLLR